MYADRGRSKQRPYRAERPKDAQTGKIITRVIILPEQAGTPIPPEWVSSGTSFTPFLNRIHIEG
jgi:hypothetical protein